MENTTRNDSSKKSHAKSAGRWFGGLAVLVVLAVVALSMLGRTVDSTFDSINSGLSSADGSVSPSGSSSVSRSSQSGDAEQSLATDGVLQSPPVTIAPPVTAPAPPVDAEDGSTEQGLFGNVAVGELPTDDLLAELEETEPSDQRFVDYGIREFVDTDADPFSTFALDVDTGSYSIARRFLTEGQLPPRESVRVEEYVNFFDYDYVAPESGLEFGIDGGPSPFNDETHILRVGVQAAELLPSERPPVALTFVVDTSGSMNSPDRLGLVKESLSLLVNQLQPTDTVAIVTYSGNAGIILEPTQILERDVILRSIDSMQAGGSTNLESGLNTGYRLAAEAFREDGVNRVILASDGIANAGVTNADALAAGLRGAADDGIGLVTVGYGLAGFNDATMEQLADKSDGFFAYVDTIAEAERLFAEDLTSTLITAAIDAKIQVEFNETVVSEYRLIGYENRAVADVDFRNDAVDAGELGAGHQATAIYEVRFAEGAQGVDGVEASDAPETLAFSTEVDDDSVLGTVNLRWEDPETGEVLETSRSINGNQVEESWASTRHDFRRAVVIASFAEVLRDNPFADGLSLESLSSEVNSLALDSESFDFQEFATLVEIASRTP